MADVKWIKIVTDIFDDEKILLIESLPDKYAIIVCWFKLLCLAGKQNNNGVFMMNHRIAYTEEMLATIFRMPLNTVRMAINTFKEFEMVEVVEGVITIPNWHKHQSLDAYEKRKERDRLYQQEKRAKQRELITQSSDKSSDKSADTSSDIALLEEDKDKDKEKDIKISTDLQSVVDLYHSICVSFPQIRSLSDARKKTIKARLKSYSLEDFKTLFENAEASSFLKGSEGGWKASFDWLIKETNMLKVLEGNYADKGKRYGYKEKTPGWMGFSMGDAEREAIEQAMRDDPSFQAEQEQLRRELQDAFGR